jgi:glucosamine-6-phosphate deaminase
LSAINKTDLARWCSFTADELNAHPETKIRFKLVEDQVTMGSLMAEELASLVEERNGQGAVTRVIVPCGPKSWYEPFRRIVNTRRISLRNLHVFHMDECLDWQGQLLPTNHPYNFRTFMEQHFYGGIEPELAVPLSQRFWLSPASMDAVSKEIASGPIDLTLGGWGQDGHLAYNQARRHPFSTITLEQLAASTIRIQDNNLDTIIALAHRSFGGAYQFVPPMSITLGIRECMSAAKVRVFSDTGAWKQTALRVALFAEPNVEYPITLLQRHPDALIVATRDTATHPISENADWQLL